MAPTREEILETVRGLLGEFIAEDDLSELTESTPLIESGILDSIATLNLVRMLEERFGIEIEAHEADADHLGTLTLITDLVETKLG